MAEAVYLLCTLTSFICALLLCRAYNRTKLRLLFWSAICFFGLSMHNILIFFDAVVFADVNLLPFRILPAIAGLSALVYGLVKESS